MFAKRRRGAEWIFDLGQWHMKIGRQHFMIWHIIWNLAKAVHIIGKTDQPRFPAGQAFKGMTNHRGANNLTKSANMRQT